MSIKLILNNLVLHLIIIKYVILKYNIFAQEKNIIQRWEKLKYLKLD